MALSDNFYFQNPKDIEFDDSNPRGETVDQIVNDPGFYKLKESINQLGILVPLIIKKKEKTENSKFLLIDGERRLRASLDLALEKVPVRIAENDVEGNIIAYQIHQNRKAWNKPSEAKSIKRIIESIKADDPNISESDLKKKLIEVTSHNTSSISDILKILKYDDDIQEKSSSGQIDHSYLVRIEDDFISPLTRSFPKVLETLGENNIRNLMIAKAELKLLINTRYMMGTSFRNIFKPCLFKDKVQLLIIDFLNSPNKSASDLYDEYKKLELLESKISSVNNGDIKEEAILNSPTNDVASTNFGTNTLPNGPSLNVDSGISKSNPIQDDKRNEKAIPSSNNNEEKSASYSPIIAMKGKVSDFNNVKQNLENIGKDFSTEELEYLKEALYCLASGKALKAAVLMIWSSAISRILNYIEKDIPKFNASSDAMQKDSKKIFYKPYSHNFQKNATIIDEIRTSAKDLQLLCYLCFEGIITQSQFKQLKSHYDIRNDCAHPTTISLSVTEVIVIFDNLYKFVFNNSKLK